MMYPKVHYNPLRLGNHGLGFLNYCWGRPREFYTYTITTQTAVHFSQKKGNTGSDYAHLKAWKSPWKWLPREPHAVEVTKPLHF